MRGARAPRLGRRTPARRRRHRPVQPAAEPPSDEHDGPLRADPPPQDVPVQPLRLPAVQRRLRRRRDEPPRAPEPGSARRGEGPDEGGGAHPLAPLRRADHRDAPRPHHRRLPADVPEPELQPGGGHLPPLEAQLPRTPARGQGQGRHAVLDGQAAVLADPPERPHPRIPLEHLGEMRLRAALLQARRLGRDRERGSEGRDDRQEGDRLREGRRPGCDRPEQRDGTRPPVPGRDEPTVHHRDQPEGPLDRDRRRGRPRGGPEGDPRGARGRAHPGHGARRPVPPREARADARALARGDPGGDGAARARPGAGQGGRHRRPPPGPREPGGHPCQVRGPRLHAQPDADGRLGRPAVGAGRAAAPRLRPPDAPPLRPGRPRRGRARVRELELQARPLADGVSSSTRWGVGSRSSTRRSGRAGPATCSAGSSTPSRT